MKNEDDFSRGYFKGYQDGRIGIMAQMLVHIAKEMNKLEEEWDYDKYKEKKGKEC